MRYGTSRTEVTLPTPTSASKRRTSARVCWRSATAMFTAIVVLPTPPFGAKTLRRGPRRRSARSTGSRFGPRARLGRQVPPGADQERLEPIDERLRRERLQRDLVIGAADAVRKLGLRHRRGAVPGRPSAGGERAIGGGDLRAEVAVEHGEVDPASAACPSGDRDRLEAGPRAARRRSRRARRRRRAGWSVAPLPFLTGGVRGSVTDRTSRPGRQPSRDNGTRGGLGPARKYRPCV